MTAPGEDILAWLQTAITKAEADADRWHDSECSSHDTTIIDITVLQGGATLCDCEGPDSVRRRCAADRKLLTLHQAVPDHGRYSGPECPAECAGQHDEHDGALVCVSCRDYAGDCLEAPCSTVVVIAEGYGWTEGER